MKKVKKITLIIMLLAVFAMSSVSAKSLSDVLKTASGDTVIDSSYAWSYGWIDGETYGEPFGFTTKEEDLWKTASNIDGKEYVVHDQTYLTETEKFDVLRVENSIKGKAGYIYHKVGKYNGNWVSMKIILNDWEKLGKSGTTTDADGVTRVAYPSIYFAKESIQVLTTVAPLVSNPEWKIQFFYENDASQTPISIKGYVTVRDLDNKEYLISNFNVLDTVYVSSDTYLAATQENGLSKVKLANTKEETDSNGNPVRYAGNWDTKNWTTILFDTSKMTDKAITFTYSDSRVESEYDASTETVGKKTYYEWDLGAYSLVPFDTPDISKTEDKTEITEGGSINYTLEFYAPAQPENKKYTSLVVTDSIDTSLQINSVKVTNEAGKDVTSKFSVSTKNNKVEVSANSSSLTSTDFYNTTYKITINCSLKKNPTLTLALSNGKYKISNQAKITTDRSTKSSSIVTTVIYYKVETSITNGKITDTDTNVVPTTDKVIEFTPNNGYKVTSIEIDGKKIDITEYEKGGKYTFKNINANHKINVICEKIPAKVTAKYIDIDTGKELTDENVITGYINDKYETKEETIDGFTIVSEKYPENASGKMLEESTEVTYYYQAIPAKLTVKYIDIDTGESIKDDEVVTAKLYDEYATEEITMDGYTLVEDKYPENAKGKLMEENTEVVYYYKAVENAETSDINILMYSVMFVATITLGVYQLKKMNID